MENKSINTEFKFLQEPDYVTQKKLPDFFEEPENLITQVVTNNINISDKILKEIQLVRMKIKEAQKSLTSGKKVKNKQIRRMWGQTNILSAQAQFPVEVPWGW